MRSSLPSDFLRTIWSEWTWSRQSPLAYCKKSLLSVFIRELMYITVFIIHLLHILYSDLIQFLFFHSVKTFSSNACFSYLSISRQYCLIILWLMLVFVQYYEPGNVFQVFRSHKEVTITCNPESINIKSSTTLAYFPLSIGCHKGLLPPSTLAGMIYGTYYSDWGRGGQDYLAIKLGEISVLTFLNERTRVSNSITVAPLHVKLTLFYSNFYLPMFWYYS